MALQAINGVHPMSRMGIWLIVLALVFNGVSAYAQIGPSVELTAMTQGQAASGREAAIHEAVADMDCADHMAAGATHGGHHQGPLHNHLRCCARCSMVSLLPTAILLPATFASRDAVFYTAQHDLVGLTVASDPHIPKPLA